MLKCKIGLRLKDFLTVKRWSDPKQPKSKFGATRRTPRQFKGRTPSWSLPKNRAAVKRLPLNSRGGFGERYRGRLLHKVIQNSSGPDRNHAGDQECNDEHAHHIFSCFSQTHPAHSSREGKCLRFNFDKSSPERAYASVKAGRLRALEIEKKTPDPGSEMLFKELTISAGRRGDVAADKARHDFAENRGVILRFRTPGRFFDAEMPKGIAQPRQRASVDGARQIVGRIRLQQATSEPDIQIEVLPLHAFLIHARRRLTERCMRQSERASVAAQQGQPFNHLGIGAA